MKYYSKRLEVEVILSVGFSQVSAGLLPHHKMAIPSAMLAFITQNHLTLMTRNIDPLDAHLV